MVNESELVTRFHNFKHVHRDDTWRDMCHSLALQLLELRMIVEELERRPSAQTTIDLNQAKCTADKILNAIQETKPAKEETLKKSMFRNLMGKKIKNS